MFLFFALFSVVRYPAAPRIPDFGTLCASHVSKTSAFIGPFISSAIITAANNNDYLPFAFLFGLGVFSTLFLYMVNVEKSHIECEEFIKAEADRKAFDASDSQDSRGTVASAYTGDADLKMAEV
ncbi:hypothetical protein MPER_12445 [Moniliophthora perniciosa FA553]|nr:hypothetical protein MPER_12445 [Moniliophthora perniciosa FA553]